MNIKQWTHTYCAFPAFIVVAFLSAQSSRDKVQFLVQEAPTFGEKAPEIIHAFGKLECSQIAKHPAFDCQRFCRRFRLVTTARNCRLVLTLNLYTKILPREYLLCTLNLRQFKNSKTSPMDEVRPRDLSSF